MGQKLKTRQVSILNGFHIKESMTKILAACLCTNWDDKIVLHISTPDRPNPEKGLIEDILYYLNQFPLTFGWYTTGVTVYADTWLIE